MVRKLCHSKPGKEEDGLAFEISLYLVRPLCCPTLILVAFFLRAGFDNTVST